MKKTVKKVRNGLANVGTWAAIVGGVSALAMFLTIVCALVVFPDSFLTTSSNFVSLETAAPALWTVFTIEIVILLASMLVCAASRYMYKAIGKKHR